MATGLCTAAAAEYLMRSPSTPRPRPFIPPEPLIFAQAALLFSWLALFFAGAHREFGLSPVAFAWIHAVVLGWLTTTALAFLIHVLPGFTDVPWRFERLARAALWVYQPGVVVLVAGFALWRPAWLSVGGAVIVVSIALFLVPFVATIADALKDEDRATRVVAGALAIIVGLLALTLFLGFALSLRLDFPEPFLWRWAGVHGLLGVIGWLCLLVAGVSMRTYNRLIGRSDRRRVHVIISLLVLAGLAAWIAGTLSAVTALAALGAVLIIAGAALYAGSTFNALRGATSRHRLPQEFIFFSSLWLAVAVAYAIAGLTGREDAIPLLFIVLAGWIGQNVNAHLMHVGIRLMATIVIAEDDETSPMVLIDRRAGVASLVFNQFAVACGVVGLSIFNGPLLEAAGVLGVVGLAFMALNVAIAVRAAIDARRRLPA